MKKLGSVVMSLVLAGMMILPMQTNAAEMQKQQGKKILVGMEQNGTQYMLPAACQTVYSLVVNPLDLQPKLVAFDGTGKQQFAVDYQTDNASVDIYMPVEGNANGQQCNTLDLATNAMSSHSSVYIYTDNGLATTQYDLDTHDIKNGVVTGTIESEDDGFFYDASGKMTSGNYGLYEYTYGADGKLAMVKADGYALGRMAGQSVVFHYQYDADGDLVSITESDVFANGMTNPVGNTNFIYQ